MASFCGIVGLSPDELCARFGAFDLEAICESQQFGAPAEEVVFRNVLGERERRCEPGSIRWFHATRALPDTDFRAKGILPTNGIVDYLWTLLRRIDPTPPTDTDWTSFRRAVEEGRLGHWSSLYCLKVKNERMSGPYAFLIREELFHFGETNSVNYFRSPETVEDLCLCYEQVFKRPLLPAFLESARPCIVAFTDVRPARVMDTVALYLYRHFKDEEAFKVNACFDAHGCAIRPDQIDGMEWPAVSATVVDG